MADLVFKTNSADYHDEMNSEHYMEWLTKQLLPGLDRPRVNILDYASYHNKQKDKPPTVYFRMVVSEQCSKLEYSYRSYYTIEFTTSRTLFQMVQIT